MTGEVAVVRCSLTEHLSSARRAGIAEEWTEVLGGCLDVKQHPRPQGLSTEFPDALNDLPKHFVKALFTGSQTWTRIGSS